VTVTAVEAEFTSDITVELIDLMGSEASIVRAARVSTLGSDAHAEERVGLLAYLYNSGHASPFEHCVMTFRVEAPIFVTREMLRHRISSFNEESGRYRELGGKFYLPQFSRPIVQVGKVGKYDFTLGDPLQQAMVSRSIRESSRHSWGQYRNMLDAGIAREVARMVLPVNTYSTIYYTANLRSILNFLSLRVDWGEGAVHRSKPQHEIELVALRIAALMADNFPTVWDLFRKNGYQSV